MTNGHPTREEDFELYALGALDAAEAQALEAHIRACADCAEKLAAARGLVAALSFSAPRVEPSPAVKERLLRQVRAEAASPSKAKASPHEFAPPEPPRGLAGRWLFAILAPACVALLIASVMLWRQNDHLTKQLAALGASVDATQKQLADAQDVLSLYKSKDTITVALAQKPGMPKGDVKVMYNEKMGMLMCDGWVETGPAGKSYQLWIVPMEGKPVSAGIFRADNPKAWHKMMKVPEGIDPKMFAITLEPAGGMPEPTGPMVMIGPAS